MTDEPQEPAATEGSDEQSLRSWTQQTEQTWTTIEVEVEPAAAGTPEPAAAGATESRSRRPASLLKDVNIPDRAASLRDTLNEKLRGSSDPGYTATPGEAAFTGIPGGGPSGGAASGIDGLRQRLRTLAVERPEAVVGAAFIGGLLLAKILKRLAR